MRCTVKLLQLLRFLTKGEKDRHPLLPLSLPCSTEALPWPGKQKQNPTKYPTKYPPKNLAALGQTSTFLLLNSLSIQLFLSKSSGNHNTDENVVERTLGPLSRVPIISDYSCTLGVNIIQLIFSYLAVSPRYIVRVRL